MRDIERLLERMNVALTELEGKPSSDSLLENKLKALTERNHALEKILTDTIGTLDDYIRTVNEILDDHEPYAEEAPPKKIAVGE